MFYHFFFEILTRKGYQAAYRRSVLNLIWVVASNTTRRFLKEKQLKGCFIICRAEFEWNSCSLYRPLILLNKDIQYTLYIGEQFGYNLDTNCSCTLCSTQPESQFRCGYGCAARRSTVKFYLMTGFFKNVFYSFFLQFLFLNYMAIVAATKSWTG